MGPGNWIVVCWEVTSHCRDVGARKMQAIALLFVLSNSVVQANRV